MLAALLIALALLIVAAPPAGATYPGRNGDLLYTERFRTHGFGDAAWLWRIDPTSGTISETRICAQSSISTFPGPQCLAVGPPASSPDGRWVAFAASDIVGGPPYTEPASFSVRVLPLSSGERRQVPLKGQLLPYEGIVRWTPDLDFVVEARRGRVLLAGPDGADRGILAAPATAPDISSDGQLAFVRGDNVHVLKPGGRARQLTRRGADQPSWSPHGRRIAFTRNDSIYTVPARGGQAQRLTRGFNPVWSPDGKQIAFFRAVRDPAYSWKVTYLYVLDLATGRVRRVTSELRADDIDPNGLDWQPVR